MIYKFIRPVFNGSRCLEAIIEQSLRPSEIIVVDDGSTDATPEILTQYPVKVIRHPYNKGLAEIKILAF